MSNDVAIRVENLSKLYRIGRAQEQHDTLRDALVSAVRAPLERLRRGSASSNPDSEDTIWALKDVSFEACPEDSKGEARRGGGRSFDCAQDKDRSERAGRSTLLKILSRITEPTSGRAVINGIRRWK